MKLNDFIDELKSISKSTDNPDMIEVKMADDVPVVSPIYYDNSVFITDIAPGKRQTRKARSKIT